jgi:hypothetical protein
MEIGSHVSRLRVAIALLAITACAESDVPSAPASDATVASSTTGLSSPPCTFRCGEKAKPGPPAQIRLIRGDLQTGTVGTTLADSLIVQVEDRWDNPIEGVAIDWIVAGDSGIVTPSATMTDANGRARARWTLGAAVPLQALRVSVADGPSLRLSANAVPR